MFFKIGVLKNITNFTGKYLCRSLFTSNLPSDRQILKNTFFYRTPPVPASDGFRFPSFNFNKKEVPAKMFFCEFCETFRKTFLTEYLRMTASCVNLKILRSFLEQRFYRAPPRTAYFMYKLNKISTSIYSQKYPFEVAI